MMDYYRLEGHTPVLCDMFAASAALQEPDARRVGEDRVGHLRVSTVFLVIDHQFIPGGPPLLFETMVSNEEGLHPATDLYCDRYSTWEEAAAGHQRVVEWLQAGKSARDL